MGGSVVRCIMTTSIAPRAMLLITIAGSSLGFGPPPRELQSAASPPPLPGCVDHLPECHQYAQDNQCDMNSIFMHKLCPRSCGQCEAECADSNILCRHWEVNDQCRLNPGYMYEHCKRSCGMCEPPELEQCQCFRVRNMIRTLVDMEGDYVKTDQTCADGSSIYKLAGTGEEWFAWYYANSRRWGVGRLADLCTDSRYAISGLSDSKSPCAANVPWREWSNDRWRASGMSVEELSVCPVPRFPPDPQPDTSGDE